MLELLKLKYPSTDSVYYSKRLITVKQDHFTLIEDYVIAIQSFLERLAVSTGMTKQEEIFKEKEIFFNGLNDYLVKNGGG